MSLYSHASVQKAPILTLVLPRSIHVFCEQINRATLASTINGAAEGKQFFLESVSVLDFTLCNGSSRLSTDPFALSISNTTTKLLHLLLSLMDHPP